MKKPLSAILIFLVGIIVSIGGSVFAGSLIPSQSPQATMYTLEDIYKKITDPTYHVEEGSQSFVTPDSVSETFYTLKNIYESIPQRLSIINSNGDFLLPENGYVVDKNTGLQWMENDYSGTEQNIGYLCWDSNAQCDETGETVEGYGAVEYCENLDLDGGGWRLPTIKEWISIVDYDAYYPATLLPNIKPEDYYASSVVYSDDTSRIWYWGSLAGGGGYTLKSNTLAVRCVREY